MPNKSPKVILLLRLIILEAPALITGSQKTGSQNP